MTTIDSREDQIVAAHSSLIVAVARACKDPAQRSQLEPVLDALHQCGEFALAQALRAVVSGRRDQELLQHLDPDGRVVVQRLLLGLRDPSKLPDPDARPDPAAAAPGLAALVHKASRGDPGALHVLGEMAEQMQMVGGDMARLGAALRPLTLGERAPEKLCAGMGALGQSLVSSILDELAHLSPH